MNMLVQVFKDQNSKPEPMIGKAKITHLNFNFEQVVENKSKEIVELFMKCRKISDEVYLKESQGQQYFVFKFTKPIKIKSPIELREFLIPYYEYFGDSASVTVKTVKNGTIHEFALWNVEDITTLENTENDYIDNFRVPKPILH